MIYAVFIDRFEVATCFAGVSLCSFLLYCLSFRMLHDLGTYRMLQIIMISIDASYTTAQLFVCERIITADGVFAMVATSPYVHDKVLCAYTSLYTLTFVMIDFNFLYRMWAIKYPFRVGLFSNPTFVLLLISIAVTECVVWFGAIYYLYLPTDSGRLRLREQTFLDFGIDTMTSAMVMGDYFLEDGSYNRIALSAVAFSCVVMAVCFGFMIYAISDIIHNLRIAKIISSKTIRLQRRLFFTLCLQTVIPLVCLYLPCAVNIILPIFHIDTQLIARATPLVISCFLPLDALAVLFSMPDCRREFMRIVKFPFYRTSNSAVVLTVPSRTDR